MTQRPKRPADANHLAKLIADIAVGEASDEAPAEKAEAQRKGGLKGGRARAGALSQERRVEIAKAAAEARWAKKSR